MENFGNYRKATTSTSVNKFHNFTYHLGSSIIILCFILCLTPLTHSSTIPLETVFTSKRLALPTANGISSEEGFPDYQSRVRYGNFPVVVPKRAALILDRILKEIESAKESNQLINDWSPISRRGNNKDKLYFRCYFNAVSCYKRK